ncbi:ComF family protein [Acidomonas methanolica]|uniref:ComF family protein n=1 Tax=Acidomonas methanolica TaxID=437 RepID=UPI002119BB42|nr:ComF family protein [Acidomonas methanolica]MCQ9154562.1 ComF family protein [Acidomonas methanolica]
MSGAPVAFWPRRLLDFVLPPRCPACDAMLPASRDRMLCGACAAQIRPAPRIDAPVPLRRHHAAFVYGPVARDLIFGLKYGDRTELARFLAGEMRKAAPDLLAANDLLVPVPLHFSRMWRRRYNQSALLARVLSKDGESPIYAPGLLRRLRSTTPLARLSAEERKTAVSGAIGVPARQVEQVRGRRVLLVDDVLTSGATAGDCARALLAAGARSVDLLTVARAGGESEEFEEGMRV